MDRLDENRSPNMEKMRKRLKSADDLELPMNDDFFDRLHDKIMAEVEKTDIAPTPVFIASRNKLRAHWRGWLYPTGGLMSLALMASLLVSQVSEVNRSMQRAGLVSDGQARIAAEAILTPENLSQTLISTQSEADFLMDVAQESFENLSVANFNKIMGEKSNN